MKEQSLIERSADGFSYGAFKPSHFSANGETVLVAWNCAEGKTRLLRAAYSNSFYHLAGVFQPQSNPLYCGVATAVMLLNALRQPHAKTAAQPATEIPDSKGQTIAFPTYVQSTFLCDLTEGVKTRGVIEYREKDASGIYRPGLGLLELKGLLEAHGVKAEGQFASELHGDAVGDFRATLKKTLSTATHFVVIHFRSDLIGGLPRGHISPLGAYDETTDSVLVIDVAAHKGPWYWAPVSHVFQAMQAKYDTQPKGGGYLVVSENGGAQK